MDKAMKAEIGKILSKYIWFEPIEHIDTDDEKNDRYTQEMIDTATSSITALIIKWLESKKQENVTYTIIEEHRKMSRNQLITELIGEIK